MSSRPFVKKIKYGLKFLPDSTYIKLYYFLQFKKFPNLKDPKTFNEKLNWLKIHDHNPEYIKMVDKYEVKKYISSIIGSEFVIPTLGVWESFDEINFDDLPQQFVLKCTHDSEGIAIVKEKNSMDRVKVKRELEKAMSENFYYVGREWPYKYVKPRIIAEPYMVDHVNNELRDYKFFCFNGEPKLMFVASERDKGRTKFDYFDLDFNHLDITQKYPNSKNKIKKPITFDKMIKISKILSKGIPHVRVDFYEVNGKLYFGELTFYHFSGFAPFHPSKWDKIMGEWLEL